MMFRVLIEDKANENREITVLSQTGFLRFKRITKENGSLYKPTWEGLTQ